MVETRKVAPLDVQQPIRGRARQTALLILAAISFAVLVYHLLVGTGEIMTPVYAARLLPDVTSVLDITWYGVALFVGLGGVAMALAAARPGLRTPLAWTIGAQYLGLAGLSLFAGYRWFGNPWSLPQTFVFLAFSALAIWAGAPAARANRVASISTSTEVQDGR